MGSNHKSQGDKNDEIVGVFDQLTHWFCWECGAELAKGRLLKLEERETSLFGNAPI